VRVSITFTATAELIVPSNKLAEAREETLAILQKRGMSNVNVIYLHAYPDYSDKCGTSPINPENLPAVIDTKEVEKEADTVRLR
jgi:hypothetical protein